MLEKVILVILEIVGFVSLIYLWVVKYHIDNTFYNMFSSQKVRDFIRKYIRHPKMQEVATLLIIGFALYGIGTLNKINMTGF